MHFPHQYKLLLTHFILYTAKCPVLISRDLCDMEYRRSNVDADGVWVFRVGDLRGENVQVPGSHAPSTGLSCMRVALRKFESPRRRHRLKL